jgi:hypothetical protein
MDESASFMIPKNEMRDFRSDITINPNNLEEEWILHASLYLHYSCQYSEAFDQKEKAKQYLEWIAAKLDLEIRKDWKKFGFNSKPAETGIKNIVFTHKKYQKALKKFNKANELFTTMTGVKTAFEHRKHSLGNLVALKIGGFYSEPRNVVKDVKKIQAVKGHKERKKELNKKMKKKGIKNA